MTMSLRGVERARVLDDGRWLFFYRMRRGQSGGPAPPFSPIRGLEWAQKLMHDPGRGAPLAEVHFKCPTQVEFVLGVSLFC